RSIPARRCASAERAPAPAFTRVGLDHEQQLRERARRLNAAAVLIHPREAAARSINAGDKVELCNEHGRIELVAETASHVPPGIALVHKGRWPKLDPNGANVNILNPG